MKYICITTFVIFALQALFAFGNTPCRQKARTTYSVADMDNDGTADSLIYDMAEMALTLKLSSRDFIPFCVSYPGVYESGVDIEALEGGFRAYSPHMRASNVHGYSYEKRTGKFRLTDFFHDHIHCGYMSLDLLDGIFVAEWHSRNRMEPDSVTYFPGVRFSVQHKAVYLGEQEPDFMSLGYNLLEDLESIYRPPSADTVRFVEILCTHDQNKPGLWDYCEVVYRDKKNILSRMMYAGDSVGLCRDDVVEIIHGYVFCHDTVENRYRISPAITHMEIVECGGYGHLTQQP